MNRIILSLSLASFTAMALFLGSCKEDDPCEEVTCLNDGTCDDGNCICEEFYYGATCGVRCVNGDYGDTCACNSGYEGTECDTEMRAKFLGTYSVYETCLTSTQDYNYTGTITEGEDGLLSIAINNFRDDDTYAPVVAQLTNRTEFVIEAQKPKGTQEVTGSGYFVPTMDTIVIEYELQASSGSNKEVCTLKLY